jgi:UDP-N-acetylmuramate: L-alanyl-gamma-D-glutamyl-meso-diaminopimelate ligase
VEFDHADIYRDLEHVKEAFRSCIAQLPAEGTLVAAVDHPNVRDVIADAPCQVISYGTDAAGTTGAGDWRAERVVAEPAGTAFDVVKEGIVAGRALVPLFGRINVENALGALATVAALGVPMHEATTALQHFRGVKRRQEIRGEERGVVVIDDFAHHPTAVRGSIESIRSRFPGRRIFAVFEPRTNTSRRKIFQSDYAEAFTGADRVVVAVVPDHPIYNATGTVIEFFSAEQLASDLQARGLPANAIDGVEAIVLQLATECEPGDVVLVMSNGAFDDIWQRLLDALRK